MDRLQKIYRLHHLLKNRRHPASLQAIQDTLESSRATAVRIIRDMRLLFDAPIGYDRERNGYFYTHELFELPGLWFSAEELLALLSLHRLLQDAQPGLMDDQLSPLKRKIEEILEAEHLGFGELQKRVRIIRMAGREMLPDVFQALSGALGQRKRLLISHSSRESGAFNERVVSPQRLTHYRDNWYLDAWCHLRNALRSFSVEKVLKAVVLSEDCIDISDEELDLHFSSSYGIFAGKPKSVAKLKFNPGRAKWVSSEKWHPEQKSAFDEDGCYILEIPYSDPRELIMDILKYGPDVEVISPEPLRKHVRGRLAQALKNY